MAGNTLLSRIMGICEQTHGFGLTGWIYFSQVKSGGKILWLLIVIASLGVATLFLHASIVDFTSSTVVTTIDTTTAPLSEVHFPSVILCSINQIRQSLFRSLGVSNSSQVNLLLQTFYTGRQTKLTAEEKQIIQELALRKEVVQKLILHWHLYSDTNTLDMADSSNINIREKFENWTQFRDEWKVFIETFDYIRDLAVEEPGDSPIITARYGSLELPNNTTSFLPFFGTDFGFCSIIKPQVTFDPLLSELSWEKKNFFGPENQTSDTWTTHSWHINTGAKVGKSNGLSILLDAETFDYMYQIKPSEGFKMAIQHHLDQPLMSVNEIDISPGFESQVAVIPTLYTTTKDATRRFTPSERGCYAHGEVVLQHLPDGMYRYDIGNCLFEATYTKVLEVCKCTPYFHWGPVSLETIIHERPFCKAENLTCMNEIYGKIGQFNEIISKNETVPCLAACEDQTNTISISQSQLPNRRTLVLRPEFCLIIQRIHKSCGGFKREGLEKSYPHICSRIQAALLTGLCTSLTWEQYLPVSNDTGGDLENQIYRYSKDNLALVNVYIKNPVVTKIKRDQKIPIIWFVANSGGILGLCMGFSMVTVFEVLHYVLVCIWKVIKSKTKVNTKKSDSVDLINGHRTPCFCTSQPCTARTSSMNMRSHGGSVDRSSCRLLLSRVPSESSNNIDDTEPNTNLRGENIDGCDEDNLKHNLLSQAETIQDKDMYYHWCLSCTLQNPCYLAKLQQGHSESLSNLIQRTAGSKNGAKLPADQSADNNHVVESSSNKMADNHSSFKKRCWSRLTGLTTHREEPTPNHRRVSNPSGQPGGQGQGQSPEVNTTTSTTGCHQSPGGCRQSPGGCRQSPGGCLQTSPRCCHTRIHNSNSRIISAKTEFISVSTQNETLF